jgi:hypothetical protein
MHVILLLSACTSSSPEQPPTPLGVLEENMTKHVEMLSSDELRGRGTFEPGLDKAAEYIVAAFQDYGLQTCGESDSFIVPYTLYQYTWETESSLSIAKEGEAMTLSNAQWRPYKFENKFHPGHSTKLEDVPLTFVGYGIDAPEHEWNDYAGLDVDGKVVLVMRRKPESIEDTKHATYNAKAAVAEKNGAIGMLVFTDPSFPEDRIKRGDGDFRPEFVLFQEPVDEADEMSNRFRRVIDSSKGFVSAHVSPNVIASLFPEQSLEEIQDKLDSGVSPSQFPIGESRVSMGWTESDKVDVQQVPNVVGMIEGTDPKLKEELVIVGAHFDHLGAFEGQGDVVFNGADDNASGTSALLELARLFSEGEKPKRSILFAAFSAEELGLLGSEAFAKQIDMTSVAFMINFDMIGRNSDQPLTIIGDGFATEMESQLASIAEEIEMPLEFTGTSYFGASDHDHFYRANRPFLFFFMGLHDDYHTLNDHMEYLDFKRMKDIATLGHRITSSVANAEYTPKFIAGIDWLGLSLIETDAGVVVHNVDSIGKGVELGFQVGDQISIQETEVSVVEYLQSLEVEQTATVSVKRFEQENDIDVFRHIPSYMGVYSEEVSEEVREANNLEEGMGLTLNVAEDGPADKSGFMDGDVLLEIGSQAVSEMGESGKGRDLVSILKNYAAGEAVDCLVLRDGEQITVEMTFGERKKRR